MRITVDIPPDLHRQAQALARDTSRTFSETVVDLMRRGLTQGQAADITTSQRTGLPVVRLGKAITTDEVRSLEDDE